MICHASCNWKTNTEPENSSIYPGNVKKDCLPLIQHLQPKRLHVFFSDSSGWPGASFDINRIWRESFLQPHSFSASIVAAFPPAYKWDEVTVMTNRQHRKRRSDNLHIKVLVDCSFIHNILEQVLRRRDACERILLLALNSFFLDGLLTFQCVW
jgi:hypothetical protein